MLYKIIVMGKGSPPPLWNSELETVLSKPVQHVWLVQRQGHTEGIFDSLTAVKNAFSMDWQQNRGCLLNYFAHDNEDYWTASFIAVQTLAQ